jgi:phospholipase C
MKKISSILMTMLLFCTCAIAQGTITHIISIKKENRSFDHYFGAYVTPISGSGIASFCTGGTAPAYPNQVKCYAPTDPTSACTTYSATCVMPYTLAPQALLNENTGTVYADVGHTRGNLVNYTDAGAMDAFPTTGCASDTAAQANQCAYAYFDRTKLGYYYSLADAYGLEDNFFSSQTPTAPAAMMWFAGQDNGLGDNPITTTTGSYTCTNGPNIGANAPSCVAGSDATDCGAGTPQCNATYKTNWTCDATHTGTSAPFTYTGDFASVSGTYTSGVSGKLYCVNPILNHVATNGVTCTSNAGCTAPYVQCMGTGFYGGQCSTGGAACVCFNGNGLANGLNGSRPATCTDVADCSTSPNTCNTSTSVGAALGAPCPNLTTIADQLNAANVTWHYYTSDQARNGSAMFQTTRYGNAGTSKSFASNNFPDTQFAIDAAAATGECTTGHAVCTTDASCGGNGPCIDNPANALPTVVFLSGSGSTNEHPGNAVSTGVAWTQTQLNAVFNNPYLYNHSIIFMTYDDSGGFYDHVYPPMSDGVSYGMRVPFMCIGPYCVHTINHLQMGFGSTLKCIEQFTGAASIGSRDSIENDACFGTGTKASPGTGANAGMVNLSQSPIPVPGNTTVGASQINQGSLLPQGSAIQ